MMQPIPNNLEVRVQHNGKRLVLSIGVEGESEGNGWREWKPFLDCGGHSEKKQNAAKALLSALAAKDAEIDKWKRRYESESGELRKEMEKAARLESANAALVALLNRVPNRLRKLADYLDADSKATGFLPTSALAAENRERADEIDAALAKLEGGE